MMIDPKYANLPWIVQEESGVYETTSLPESDQFQLTNDELFKKTDKKLELMKEIDVYEMPDSEETPMETYKRLLSEVNILDEQIKAARIHLKESSVDISGKASSDSSTILSNEKLQNLSLRDLNQFYEKLFTYAYQLDQVSDMNLEKGVHLMDPFSGMDHKKLLSNIDAYKDMVKKSGKGSSQQQKCVYQLYANTSNKSALSSKHIELEQRIDSMMALLGKQGGGRDSLLTFSTLNKGLVEAVYKICSRSTFLSNNHLEQVEPRLVALLQRLNGITERKDIITAADTHNKVAELYSLVKKWDSLSASLPTIIDRLTSLQLLNEQASQFGVSLKQIETEQLAWQQLIESNKREAEKIHNSMQEAKKEIKDCIAVLHSQFK